MKFFGRRRPSNDNVRPGLLPALNPVDAEWLIKEAAAAFARHGVPVTDAGDGRLLREGDGFYGLDNLAIMLERAPRSEWPAMVEHHVVLMTAPESETPSDFEGFTRIVYPRLMAAEYLPEPVPAYAPEFGGGLWTLAALDYPETVRTLAGGDEVEAFGGWSAIAGPAMANLRALTSPDHETTLADDDEPGSVIHVFSGQDFFVASRLLIIDELMAPLAPSEGKALLASVTTRDLLLVHVAEGLAMISALNWLAGVGLRAFDREPGGLSPHVYFRAPTGEWHQVPVHNEKGKVSVHVDGALADFLFSLEA